MTLVFPDVRRMRQLATIALSIALLWTAIAAFLATKDTYLLWSRGLAPDLALALANKGLFAAAWAIATPIVVHLARAFPIRRPNRLRNALVIAAVVCTAAPLLHLFVVLARDGADWRRVLLANRAATFVAILDNVLPIAFIGFIAQHLDHRAATARRRRDEAELHAELARAQLRQLHADLDPHFLFNALNAVAALIVDRPAEAKSVLGQLSDLLHRSLQWHGRSEIALEEELHFVSRYLEIQRVRVGARLQVAIDAHDDAVAALVPPLVLQPLVENAILHGEAGAVTIHATRDGDTLRLEVRDDGPGFADESTNGGRGLTNIRARLRLLHGQRQSLTFHRDGRWFVAAITLPFRS